MEINIRLNKNFTTQFNKLLTEYGTEMAALNGLSDEQLSYTDFIDNFVDKQTVADASIDGNANVGHKDIVTLINEMPKPHQKLLALNKIYHEINKTYGFKTANDWLRAEWNGHLYMHDANTTSFVHYCFRGDTKFMTDKGIKTLKEMEGQDCKVLNKNRGWEKATVKNFGRDVLYKLVLERYGTEKEIYTTGNHIWFVKQNRELSEITTENLQPGMKIPFNASKVWSQVLPSPFGVAHGFFTGDGFKSDERPTANFCGDKVALLPYFTPAKVNGTEIERKVLGIPLAFNKLPSINETLGYLYGWLSGYFAADGCIDSNGRCTISSTKKENLEFARDVMCILGMPVYSIREQTRISNLTNEEGTVYNLTISSEYLKDDFFILPIHKQRYEEYKQNNDKKHRNWIVKSVENTGVVDDVYCVVAYETQSFTLDNNVLSHNCFAYDLKDLAEKGLFFIENFNAEPPKHLETFVDFVKEFVSWTCNRSSGAVGLPNLIPYMYYFWRKDCDDGLYTDNDRAARQQIQRLIYALNQPFLRSGIQSAFTNTSVFDHPYLEALFGGSTFPDGSFMIDDIEGIMDFQKLYMETMSDIRSKNMMTFPVSTISLLKQNGKFVDEEFARWACVHNMEWNDSNIFVDDSVTSLSNCCFDGNQKILVKSSDGVFYMPFRDFYNAPYSFKRNLTIFHNGSWVKGKPIRVKANKLYRIRTANNKEILVTSDHINVTQRGDIPTCQLTTNDYLMFSTRALNSVHEVDHHLTYEQGFLIGMYAGDGSMSDEYQDHHTTVINLSLNKAKYEQSKEILEKVLKRFGTEAFLGKEYNNVYPVRITSNETARFIRSFINGNYSFEKSLNLNCLLQSAEFRRGILDGYYLTDGGNSNRIYTSSPMMAECLEVLATSLGLQTIINISDRTNEPVIIRDEVYNRNYPLYCIRWYESGNRRKLADTYLAINNSIFFKIVSIEEYNNTDLDGYVYCFEMNNRLEPYFTLPNGIITHNCRLKSDIKDLGYFNSISGSALKVGSVKVSTVNLARLALENKTEDEYITALENILDIDLKALDRVRYIISRNVEKGLLKNFALGIVDFSFLYNTVGVIGIYETMKTFGYTYQDDLGNTYYTANAFKFGKRIFDTIHRVKDEFAKDKDYKINCEQIPGESAAAKLMRKDKFFYPDTVIDDLPLYGNQFMPLGIKTTLQERIRTAAAFDSFCNGGSILHINLESPFTNFDQAWDMLNYVSDSGVTYFAFNNKIQACENNHAFFGKVCPECGKPVHTEYTRIVGFFVPVKTYSKERKAEFEMREWMNINGDEQ